MFKRHKEGRKSRHKSLKEIVSGFSRRLSRKLDSGALSLSLPSSDPSTQTAGTSPAPLIAKGKPPIKPKPKIKSKYLKKESHKTSSATAVADIVNRYSTSDYISAVAGEPDEASGLLATDTSTNTCAENPAYDSTEHDRLTSVNSSTLLLPPLQNTDDDLVRVSFDQHSDKSSPPQQRTYSHAMDREQLTPMTGHAPASATGFALYKGSICIEGNDDT